LQTKLIQYFTKINYIEHYIKLDYQNTVLIYGIITVNIRLA